MPLELNYSSIGKRFDFGVPLEDIFTVNDIHPRLKFLFERTYGLYLESQLTIEDILEEQCYLHECLALKHDIVYEKQSCTCWPDSVAAYFWTIRHFLGLLPIPLLPTKTSICTFPWHELARKCRNLLKYNLKSSDTFNFLSYSIARAINKLPKEHVLLLNTLIIFIRGISKKKLCKKTLKILAIYYCDAVFVRPFTPGLQLADDQVLPLMIYLLSKWNLILKYLRTDYIPSFNYIVFEIEKSREGSFYPNIQRFPSVIRTLYNAVPVSNIKCLKDAESQTETTVEHKTGSLQTLCSICTMTQDVFKVDETSMTPEDDTLWDMSHYNKDQIYLKSFSAPLKMQKTKSFVSSLIQINECEENASNKDNLVTNNRETSIVHNSKEIHQCQNECNIFNSTAINENKNWSDVVEEIQRTVKKIESYNYEENASATTLEYRSASSSPIESTFSSGSIGTEYMSFQDTMKSFDGTQRSHGANKKNNQTLRSLYKSFYSSDDELYSLNERFNENWEDSGETSSNFSTKKLRLSLGFLKSFSPTFKKSKKALRSIAARNIKYMKINSSSS